MAQADFPAAIIFQFGKDEIVTRDTSRAISEIECQILRFLEMDNELSGLPVEAMVAKGSALMQRSPRLSFSIHGYDEDPRPLWAFQEIRDWAWTWFRQQPYCILFIEDRSCLLLPMLCLGGFNSRKYHGYIPDFTSGAAAEFQSVFDSALGILLAKYGNPWLLGGFAIGRSAYLKSQFDEMRNQTSGVGSEPKRSRTWFRRVFGG